MPLLLWTLKQMLRGRLKFQKGPSLRIGDKDKYIRLGNVVSDSHWSEETREKKKPIWGFTVHIKW